MGRDSTKLRAVQTSSLKLVIWTDKIVEHGGVKKCRLVIITSIKDRSRRRVRGTDVR